MIGLRINRSYRAHENPLTLQHTVWRIFLFPLLLSLFPFLSLFPQGARATFVLSTGEELTGEILYSRKDALILTTKYSPTEEKLILHADKIRTIRMNDVHAVKLLGASHVFDGIAIGFIGGICIGSLMAFDPHADARFHYDEAGMGEKALVIFAGVGTALGCVTGITTSTHDLDIDIHTLTNFNYFRQFSRYGEEEPDFLIRWETTIEKEL